MVAGGKPVTIGRIDVTFDSDWEEWNEITSSCHIT